MNNKGIERRGGGFWVASATQIRNIGQRTDFFLLPSPTYSMK